MAANVLRDAVAVWGSYRASKSMHERLLSHVLALPMAFFDSQPLGRLLNRFTKDTEAIDEELLQLVSYHSASLHWTQLSCCFVQLCLQPQLYILLCKHLLTVRIWSKAVGCGVDEDDTDKPQ